MWCGRERALPAGESVTKLQEGLRVKHPNMTVGVAYDQVMSLRHPIELAHVLGRRVTAAAGKEAQKNGGQFMTPPAIARLTAAKLVQGSFDGTVRVLEPAAGAGILACAVCEALAVADTPPKLIVLTLFELDPTFADALTEVLAVLTEWLSARGIDLRAVVRFEDYVMANANALDKGLFDSNEAFDLVISNPPYFKVAKNDRRALACASIVHGQPNIYGFFMAIGAACLAAGGRLAFIVPRSFASGPYFQLFRERFFIDMRPDSVHVFRSRTDAFADDDVLQESVVFLATKAQDWSKRSGGLAFTVSASQGIKDLMTPEVFRLPLAEVLDLSGSDKVLCLPSSAEEVAVFHRLKHWTGSLHKYGWDISTGPVVPFRAEEVIVSEPTAETIPLLWMQNVRLMQTTWPVATRKAQYLRDCDDSNHIALPNKNYVLMRRFSPKEQERRLMVAPVLSEDLAFERIGLENHLNYVHKPKGELSADEVFGLSALLNSRIVDAWFRSTNGNTQVSATELRAMPLPPVEVIRAIGREAQRVNRLEEIDEVVERLTATREPEIA